MTAPDHFIEVDAASEVQRLNADSRAYRVRRLGNGRVVVVGEGGAESRVQALVEVLLAEDEVTIVEVMTRDEWDQEGRA